jgi:putative tricarboxylic transport membrane protein
MTERDTGTAQGPGDLAGAIGSALAIVVGAAAIWAARDYSDLGAVFPRTVGALLVVLGIVYIVLFAIGRTHAQAALQGSTLRRVGVAIVMLAWAFTLVPLGFLPSSAAAMAALLVIANHHRWTLRSALLYAASTGLVLAALYVLFKHALRVPLP